jgi:hypothetical protein
MNDNHDLDQVLSGEFSGLISELEETYCQYCLESSYHTPSPTRVLAEAMNKASLSDIRLIKASIPSSILTQVSIVPSLAGSHRNPGRCGTADWKSFPRVRIFRPCPPASMRAGR